MMAIFISSFSSLCLASRSINSYLYIQRNITEREKCFLSSVICSAERRWLREGRWCLEEGTGSLSQIKGIISLVGYFCSLIVLKILAGLLLKIENSIEMKLHIYYKSFLK